MPRRIMAIRPRIWGSNRQPSGLAMRRRSRGRRAVGPEARASLGAGGGSAPAPLARPEGPGPGGPGRLPGRAPLGPGRPSGPGARRLRLVEPPRLSHVREVVEVAGTPAVSRDRGRLLDWTSQSIICRCRESNSTEARHAHTTRRGAHQMSDVATMTDVEVLQATQEIAGHLSAVTAGDVTPIHLLTTSEIEILSPTRAHAVWAMADLIFRNEN